MPLLGSGIIPSAEELEAATRRAFIPRMVWTSYGGSFSPDWVESAFKKWPWPRSIDQRINRMNEFVDWKRRKIRERETRKAVLFLAIAAGLPLVIAALSAVWKLALYLVLG